MAVITRSVDLAVVVGANGGGWATDLGASTPLVPTSSDAALGAAFHPLGGVGEERLAYEF